MVFDVYVFASGGCLVGWAGAVLLWVLFLIAWFLDMML